MSERLIAGRVLITGASGGLGAAIARGFAAHGAELLLSGRRRDALEQLAAELGGQVIVADLAERGDVDRLIAEAGAVDVLVANAALPASGALTELTQPQIDAMLEVNLRSQIALARGIAPQMVKRAQGQIVFISSLAGIAASPAASLYNATKFGLRGFALAAREDLRSSGVGVSVVLPGFIRDAGMFADADTTLPRGVGTRTSQDVAKAVLDAVRRDRAEVTVAPLGLLVGARVASVLPGLAARVQRLAGGSSVSRRMAAGQVDKRP